MIDPNLLRKHLSHKEFEGVLSLYSSYGVYSEFELLIELNERNELKEGLKISKLLTRDLKEYLIKKEENHPCVNLTLYGTVNYLIYNSLTGI